MHLVIKECTQTLGTYQWQQAMPSFIDAFNTMQHHLNYRFLYNKKQHSKYLQEKSYSFGVLWVFRLLGFTGWLNFVLWFCLKLHSDFFTGPWCWGVEEMERYHHLVCQKSLGQPYIFISNYIIHKMQFCHFPTWTICKSFSFLLEFYWYWAAVFTCQKTTHKNSQVSKFLN